MKLKKIKINLDKHFIKNKSINGRFKFSKEIKKIIFINSVDNVSQLYWHLRNSFYEIPKCKRCDSNKKWESGMFSYNKCSNIKCQRISARFKRERTNEKRFGLKYFASTDTYKSKVKGTLLQKYGVDNPVKIKNVKEKIKQTNLERYDSEYAISSDKIKNKIKNTFNKKYDGNPMKNNEIKKKAQQTCFKRYGFKNPGQSLEIKKKIKNTNCILYNGHPMKNNEIKKKAQQTCLDRYGVHNFGLTREHRENMSKIATERFENGYVFKNLNAIHEQSDLFYQGSYEKDFLDTFHNKFKIEKAPRIKYFFNDIKRIYIPDFYLREYNLIIEIKSNYTFNIWKEKNLAKEQACLKQGYKFMFVINKDYSLLEDFLTSI